MATGINHEWHTARELAALALPRMPKTRRGILKRAAAEKWQAQERKGRGGGVAYHISSLPQMARIALLEKQIAPAPAPTQLQQEIIAPEKDKKLSGRLLLLSAIDMYRIEHGVTLSQATSAFLHLYNHGAQTSLPSWVKEVFPKISERSVWQWHKAKKEKRFYDLGKTQNNREGTSILVRAEGGKVKDYIAALIISQPHLTSSHVIDLCRAKFGTTLNIKNEKTGMECQVPLPDIRTFRRFMTDWVKNNADLYERATNPDGFKNKRQMAIGKADYGIIDLNQEWQIDASPADVLCKDGRYSVYAVIDVWSRRAMFTIARTARTESALLLIRKAIIEWGVPQSIKTDNGSDFTSHRFVNALRSLGIDQKLCRPFTPESKPFVERVIRTLQHDLMPLLPGYVGHSVKDRKQIEARKTFAARLGESDANTFSVDLEHEKLQAMIDRWAKDKYAHAAHGGLNGQTPFNRAASSIKPILRVESERALDLLLAPLAGQDGYRTVGKKGLRIDKGHFYGAGLELYVGKRVFARHDADDMGRVFVFDEDGLFICEAINYDRLGVDPAAAAMHAKAEQKRFIREQTAELNKEKRKITPEHIAEEYLSQAAQDRSKITAFPKRAENYTTDALSQATRAIIETTASTQSDPRELENFIASFKDSSAQIETLSDEERWIKRYQTIKSKEDAGETLSQTDTNWLRWAEATHWFKAFQDLEQMRGTGA